jgi:hypothetical protein
MSSHTTTPSRRALLAGAPAVAAAALAGGTAANVLATGLAKAAEADPVFAAIEREREAYAAYCAADELRERIEDRQPIPPPVRNGVPDYEANEKRRADPAHKVWWDEYCEAEADHDESIHELWDARADFLTTQPTTMVGLRVYIDHIEGPLSAGEVEFDDEERALAFPTLAAAVRSLIGGSQS